MMPPPGGYHGGPEGVPWGAGAGGRGPSPPMDPAVVSQGMPAPRPSQPPGPGGGPGGFVDPAIVGFRPEAAPAQSSAAEPAGNALPPMLQQLFKKAPAGEAAGGGGEAGGAGRVRELEQEVARLKQELEAERAARKDDRMKMASMVSEVKAKWTMDKETIAQLQKELAAARQAGAGHERNQSLLERLNIQAPPTAGSVPGAWGGAASHHLG